MTEATEHPVPPRQAQEDREETREADRQEAREAGREAFESVHLDQVWHAAGFARVEQADEVIDLATQVHGLAADIDNLLGALRRELHIALGTRGPETDFNLPRDVVDVLDEISGAAEGLQQTADEIVSAVEKERKR